MSGCSCLCAFLLFPSHSLGDMVTKLAQIRPTTDLPTSIASCDSRRGHCVCLPTAPWAPKYHTPSNLASISSWFLMLSDRIAILAQHTCRLSVTISTSHTREWDPQIPHGFAQTPQRFPQIPSRSSHPRVTRAGN
ncbi:hypothetical protein FA13DRAFT_937095 [Coprinellus micaceus]|uniref:Secreted protein n=1 Tax=Coprinellus micaceus TaxID=71717 RepID=A0A4Y7T0K7_COPMI|nr:hypothetical protein FA13DRAFT_937095 [Coprinellus micaceus]